MTEQVFSAPTAPVVAVAAAAGDDRQSTVVRCTPQVARASILSAPISTSFLKQIKIAEAHAAGTPLQDLIPNIRLAYGLRSVDGSENNLLDQAGINQTDFGAADTTFPRLLPPISMQRKPARSYAQTERAHVIELAAAHHLQPDRRPDRQ